MKKTLQFYDNIKQKRPLWGIWDQLEIDTENNLNLLKIILSLAKQSQGIFKTKKAQFFSLPFALVILKFANL